MSVMDSVTSTISTVSSAVSTVTSAVNSVSSILSNAGTLATSSLGSIIASLPVSSTLDSLTSGMSDLASTANIVSGGTAEALSKVKQLVGSAGEAMSNPIAFVSKTLKDTVDGFISSGDKNASLADALTISPKTLSTLADRSGLSSISTTSELTTALNTLSDTVYSNISDASTIIADTETTLASTTTGISTLISDGISNDLSLSANVNIGNDGVSANIAASVGNTSLVVNGSTSQDTYLTAAAVTTLSDNLTTTLGYLDTDTVTSQTTQLQNRLSKAVSSLASEMSYTDVDTAYQKVLSLSDSSYYPRYTDSDGNTVTNLVSSTSSLSTSDIKSFIKTVSNVVPNMNMPTVSNYDELKNIYDVALETACSNGMISSINAMTTYTPYFDNRSKSILKTHLDKALTTGNVELYQSLVSGIGTTQIANPTSDMKTLLANMDNTKFNIEIYNSLLSQYGITASSLVQGTTYGDITSLSTESIAYLSATNPNAVDTVISPQLRRLALQMRMSYQDA